MLYDNAPSRPLFSVFGIPVTVSAWHFLLLLLLVFYTPPPTVSMGIAMMLLASFSVLLHELGHALVSLALNLQPEVVLTSMGGYTRHQPASRPRDEFIIVAAGPTMNFLLATALWLTSRAVGNESVLHLLLWGASINVIWGLYNLLPILPMDGGLLLRVILRKAVRGLKADRIAHGIGVALGGVLTALAIANGMLFVAMVLGLATFENYQAIRALTTDDPERHVTEAHGRVRELLDMARTSFAEARYEDAIRACHQARAEPYLSRDEAAHVWHILAIASARQEEWEDALRYAERVPGSTDMAQVQAACLLAIADAHRIRKFLATPTALLLPEDRIGELQHAARA